MIKNKARHRSQLLISLWILLWDATIALTVDNQLVSARNDCFERIALEAMLPFEKTFRTEDTNSLKMCKEKCLQAGEKCQAISFGVHRRGNGTCQLSSEQYSSSSGGRPGGVIFDPDFDLYSRKTNCFDLSNDNAISPHSSLSTPISSPYPPLPPVVQLPNRPMDGPLLAVNPSPPTSGLPSRPLDRPLGIDPSHAPTLPTSSIGDRLYFTHEIYPPLYKYPMLYEHNYPAPNDDVYIPGGYAANVPEVDDRYRPSYAASEEVDHRPHGPPPRPIFGLGYGNGYSYGTPERYHPPTTIRPSADERPAPSYAPRPGPRPEPTPGGYPSERPEYGTRPSYEGHREPRPDYTNRPDPPHDGMSSSARPPPPNYPGNGGGAGGPPGGYQHGPPPPRDDYVRRNGSVMRPDGYDDDKTIATYFNPEDYMQGNKKRPMANDRDRDRDRDRFGYPMDELKGKFTFNYALLPIKDPTNLDSRLTYEVQ